MALTAEELEQIRAVVRSELDGRPSPRPGHPLAPALAGPPHVYSPVNPGKIVLIIGGGFLAAFLALLALHVLVIGGLTVYHLLFH
jgi:hypothetical protein